MNFKILTTAENMVSGTTFECSVSETLILTAALQAFTRTRNSAKIDRDLARMMLKKIQEGAKE